MRDMYDMHSGWLRCQDCGGLPNFDKQCCKECEGVNFRDGILSIISIDTTVASMLPQGYSHESIDAMHRAHNDADVRSHRDDELSESDVPDLVDVSSSDSDDRPFG